MVSTPLRNVRVSDETWQAAKDRADERGDNLSDVIRTALEAYVAEEAQR